MPPSTTFENAIQVRTQGSGTYTADLQWDWSVGAAPNGGYIAAIFYRATMTHCRTRHPNRHNRCALPITMQLSYIRRCEIGPAVFRVEDIKLGSRISVIHVTLLQQGRSAVAGYVAISDAVSESGISVPTNWSVYGSAHPNKKLQAPPVLENASANGVGKGGWKKVVIANPEFRRASSRVELYEVPGRTNSSTGVGHWARLCHRGENTDIQPWTMESVAFLADILPTVLGHLEQVVHEVVGGGQMGEEPAPVWFPTLALNIDFKRFTLRDRDEWLYSDIHIKSIQNGRMDVEVVIFDVFGELVAVATQAALVMSSKRNTAGRNANGLL